MKTYTLKTADIEHHWWLVDASDQPLGRLASRIAQILRGKHKPTFTPYVNGGDCVIVINAEKVRLTGRKVEQKRYFRHTGYMGHERFTPVQKVLGKFPERVIEKAVWGMLPKTTLSRQHVKQMLKVYAGPEHPHAAQQPTPLVAVEAK
jgi:large subunit ribosomal protein L13